MIHAGCPLCGHKGKVFYTNVKQLFYKCTSCAGIFRDSKSFLSKLSEKERYKHHKNHINDTGYLKFVAPILESVKNNFKINDNGLDFGAGHVPVIAQVLQAQNYDVEIYDPLFFDNKSILNRTFDYIICCEVMEHFQNPKKEIQLLFDLLNKGGKLLCMTLIYNDKIDFGNWFYKNDPTHVFLFQKETLIYIKNHFNFSDISIKDRFITFTK